jgi:hypothetical protein
VSTISSKVLTYRDHFVVSLGSDNDANWIYMKGPILAGHFPILNNRNVKLHTRIEV